VATSIKLGWHIETTGGVSANLFATAKRLHDAGHMLALAVVIDDVALANAMATVCRYVIFRSYPAGQTFRMGNLVDTQSSIAEANKVWANHQGAILNLDKRCFVQTRNEAGINEFDSDYEIRIQQLAEAQGYRSGMAGDSVGTPTPTQWQWRIPALRRAFEHGHAAVLHEYSAFVNGKPSNTPLCDPATRDYYGLRHRALYASVPADCRPLLLIGESGLSTVNADSMDDLRGYNALLCEDAYVGGMAYYGLGASQYNLNGQLPAIEQLVMSL